MQHRERRRLTIVANENRVTLQLRDVDSLHDISVCNSDTNVALNVNEWVTFLHNISAEWLFELHKSPRVTAPRTSLLNQLDAEFKLSNSNFMFPLSALHKYKRFNTNRNHHLSIYTEANSTGTYYTTATTLNLTLSERWHRYKETLDHL